MNVLEAIEITKVYSIGDRRIPVVDRVSLSVRESEFLVVQGESGSGKTTLLSLLSGLDKPTFGRVRVMGTDITDLTEDDLAPLRNEAIGFVFQSFHLVPSLTAAENVLFPAELKRDPAAHLKAQRLLQRVGLSERGGNFPHQLSGGEKQRVAICRALINGPRIVFADEPTGNLDTGNGKAILDLLLELHREHRTTLLLATHFLRDRRTGRQSDHPSGRQDRRRETACSIGALSLGRSPAPLDSPSCSCCVWRCRSSRSSLSAGSAGSVNRSMLRDARQLRASDVMVRSHYDFSPGLSRAVDQLEQQGMVETARVWEFHSMVRAVGENVSLLASLKVVERGYPFYGTVALESGKSLGDVLTRGAAVVGRTLLDRLRSGWAIACRSGRPRSSSATCCSRNPTSPGVLLPRAEDIGFRGGLGGSGPREARQPSRVLDAARGPGRRQHRPSRGWAQIQAREPEERVETFRTAESGVKRFLDNFLFFLGLIGVFTLLLAGIGIETVLTAFLWERERTVGIMKAVGATSRFIIVQYLVVVSPLGLVGTLLGILVSFGLQAFLPRLFQGLLPRT